MSTAQPIQYPKRRPSIWQGWLRLLVLFIVLIAVNMLYKPIKSNEVVLEGEPGDLLYAAAFDGFADEWQQYEGRLEAKITDGVLRIDNGETGTAAWSVTRSQFTDFDARATMTAVDGPENNGYGMILRLHRAEADCAFDYPLVCDLSKNLWLNLIFEKLFNPRPTHSTINYMMFLISSNGYYSVWEAVDGDSVALSTWIESPLINQGIGEPNALRVIAQGDQYQFYINAELVQLCIPDDPNAESTYFMGDCVDGMMVDTLSYDLLESGQIGLAVQTELFDPDVVVEFDNLIVYQPEPFDE